jgi:hypothetical protein
VQVAHFVQENGAAIGQLKFAAARSGGAGERALLVAEQFALDQFGGDGGAIHFHEGAPAAKGLF